MVYRKLILKTNTVIEIEEAIAYYAVISIDLARKLEQEIRRGFQLIYENPESFQ